MGNTVPQMSELTVSQKTPSSPPGGAETQMSMREFFFLFFSFYFCNDIHTRMSVDCACELPLWILSSYYSATNV